MFPDVEWTKISAGKSGDIPSKRTGHCMNFIGDALYIFAGSNNEKILNDLWKFSDGAWTKIDYKGEISARSGSKSCVLGDYLFIYGGYTRRGGEYFKSLHRYCQS